MPKISVIVPIYNAAVYLEKCLSSLQTQSFKDIEILCIDDGSTDNTYALLKRFSTKDKRLKFFTQKHQGPGVARNVGIQKSTGNYLCFVDADDICHKDMLKTAYEQAVNPNHITQTLSAEQITCLKSYRIFFSTFFPIADIVYKSGLKTVSFVHDIFAVRIPNLLYTIPQAQKHHKKWIDELHADFLIFNSVFSQTDFLNYRTDYPKEKTVVSYLGADSHFTPRQEAEILAVKKTYHITTPKYFLTLSDNMPRKNIEHLIRAFIQFLKKTKAKDISLVLAGPHYLNNTKLADFKKTLKLYRSQIIFTGFIKEEDLPALYSGALAFVFPSLYEGFGLPVLEALCCKTAVICSNNTSLPEVAGKAALYISGQKISETTSALETLYQKPTVRKRLLAKAEEQSAQFSWEKTSKIIADTFLKLK